MSPCMSPLDFACFLESWVTLHGTFTLQTQQLLMAIYLGMTTQTKKDWV